MYTATKHGWEFNETIHSESGTVTSLIQEVALHFDPTVWGKQKVFRIRLAIEEALINALKHGNDEDPQKKISMTVCVEDTTATFIVTDEGGGFNPADIPDPTAEENLERPCGRGLLLMRAYMDLFVETTSAGGARVTMTTTMAPNGT